MTSIVTNPNINRLFFKKSERIRGKLTFQQLFQAGNSFKSHGVKFVYKLQPREKQEFSAMLAFAVPKKFCKKAVKRNQIKRKLREAYRLSKLDLWAILQEKHASIQFVCIYPASDVLPLSVFQKALLAFYRHLHLS